MSEPTPRDPEWMVRSKISRLISTHYGETWDCRHRRLALRMFDLWQAGQLHYVNFEPWLLGRLHG